MEWSRLVSAWSSSSVHPEAPSHLSPHHYPEAAQASPLNREDGRLWGRSTPAAGGSPQETSRHNRAPLRGATAHAPGRQRGRRPGACGRRARCSRGGRAWRWRRRRRRCWPWRLGGGVVLPYARCSSFPHRPAAPKRCWPRLRGSERRPGPALARCRRATAPSAASSAIFSPPAAPSRSASSPSPAHSWAAPSSSFTAAAFGSASSPTRSTWGSRAPRSASSGTPVRRPRLGEGAVWGRARRSGWLWPG